MTALSANAVDIIVLAIIGISALLAFSRGFTRELLSVAGWVAAIFATLYGLETVVPYVRQVVTLESLATLVAGAALFISTLVLVSFFSHIIAKKLRDSPFGALDRSLGLLFGAVRGGLIAVLAYIAVGWAYPGDARPVWLDEARTAPPLERGAHFLVSLAPPYWDHTWDRARSMVETMEPGGIDREVNRLSNPQPVAGKTAEETGYSKGERREMDRLHNSLSGD